MARWPDQARDVREALSDPWAVIRALGLDKGAQRQAGGALVCCPAHGDRTPSCSVTRGPDGTVRVRCFGCDLAGDVFALVAAARGLDAQRDFPSVLREAAELAGVELVAPQRPERAGLEPSRKHPLAGQRAGLEPARARPLAPQAGAAPLLRTGLEPVQERPPVPETSGPDGRTARVSPATIHVQPAEPAALELDVFDALVRVVLEACPFDRDDAVREYLRRRILLVGARDDAWAALPENPDKRRELVARIVATCGRDAWQRSGLARGADFLFPEHRLVIPWRTPDGRIATVQRRALDNRRNKYVFASGRSPLWPYGVEALRDATRADLPVLLVEGAADVLAVRELADPELSIIVRPYVALGVPGVATWRDTWTALLGGRSLCIGFDRDKAGEDQAPKLSERLLRAGLRFATPWRIKPSEASTVKDWGALLEERFNHVGT